MFKWSDLEFPNRVIAIVITIVAVILVVLFSRAAYGQVTLTSSVADAFVYSVDNPEPAPLPVTQKVRSGRYAFVVDAPGYVAQEVNVTVFIFQKQTRKVELQKSPYDFSKPNTIPLYSSLPYETLHFRIDAPDDNGEYRVTLLPDFNGPDDAALYKKQLTDYGNEVLAWMKSKGADPSKLSIVWLPERPAGISIGVSDPQGVIVQKRWWQFWK